MPATWTRPGGTDYRRAGVPHDPDRIREGGGPGEDESSRPQTEPTQPTAVRAAPKIADDPDDLEPERTRPGIGGRDSQPPPMPSPEPSRFVRAPTAADRPV